MDAVCANVFPIFLKYKKDLSRYLHHRVKDEAEVDDILHDILIKLHENCEKVHSIKQIRSWLFTVAHHRLMDFYREQKKMLPSITENTLETAVDETEALQEIAETCLMGLAHKLPERYREPLMMAEMEGISQKEIAVRLGISYSGAKSRVQRAREMLKEAFYNCCTECLTQ